MFLLIIYELAQTLPNIGFDPNNKVYVISIIHEVLDYCFRLWCNVGLFINFFWDLIRRWKKLTWDFEGLRVKLHMGWIENIHVSPQMLTFIGEPSIHALTNSWGNSMRVVRMYALCIFSSISPIPMRGSID